MADETKDNSNGNQGIDVAKIGASDTSLPKVKTSGTGVGLNPATKEALESMAKHGAAMKSQQADLLGQFSEGEKYKEMLDNVSSAKDAMKRFTESPVMKDIRQQLDSFQTSAKGNKKLADLAKNIARQHRVIEDLAKPSVDFAEPLGGISIPDLKNPIIETNERLERIERQFSQFQVIARESATIATGLQEAAAAFLQKFEAAAEKNDESADKAISVGRQAVWMAVLVPVVILGAQFLGTYVMQDPDTAVLQQSVADLRSELEALRESQKETTDRLIDAIEMSDAATAAALVSVVQGLSQPISDAPTIE
ncbi:hypothetical protein [Ruegeria sp. HKCCD6119]|uniref:hypothetical protein n=1 Tax=Ruegeria sp. HKCCD6119 TaxID=2683003 RepID=UPI0014917D26|nr:hypothetical protein [Ruegeria sp. HKCCD6119]NOD83766.1 hypothetical protein [Ruegeria sp. HKCCD6119]